MHERTLDVDGPEPHAIRVEREDLARVHADVPLFDETNLVATEDSQPSTASDVLEEDVDLCRVNALRLRSGQT
jgi:hypothetical protein